MENNQDIKQIDVVKILHVISSHRRTYFVSLPIVMVVASLIILSVPRYYRSKVMLAPEMSSFSGNSLSDIASSFGVDLSTNMGNNDAIFPELYPDVVTSIDFIAGLFSIQVKSSDGAINTNYYDYLRHYQKTPWWNKAIGAVTSIFQEKDTLRTNGKLNPFRMSRQQYAIVKLVTENVTCDVDKKNFVITIGVKDQDPLICATMADSVKMHLQQFITDYRTKKARNDVAHIRQLYKESKEKYEKARRTYAFYSDSNTDVVLESFRSKQEDLENEMQLQFNNYSALRTQLQAAEAKVVEKTPAFTTLQSPTVPILPAGPQRTVFVLIMTLLAFLIETAWFLIRKSPKA